MSDGGAGPPLGDVSAGIAGLVAAVERLASEGTPPVGLADGDRATDEVAALLAVLPRVEAILAMRMARAETAGALPFLASGGMATHRWWSTGRARGLSRAGRLANRHPEVAADWTAGRVTVEHVDAVAVAVTGLPEDRAAAVVDAAGRVWGQATPPQVRRFCARARAIVDPAPEDPDARAMRARAQRFVSFAVLDDTVHISGSLARLDGELLMNTLHATAEGLRVAGDGLTAGQRRADALVALVAGAGVPAAVSVTITTSTEGVTEAVTSGGYHLTPGETRHALCDPELTTVLVRPPHAPTSPAAAGGTGSAVTGAPGRCPTSARDGVPGPRQGDGADLDADPGRQQHAPGGGRPGADAGWQLPAPRAPGDHGGGDGRHHHPPSAWRLQLAGLVEHVLRAPQPMAVGRTQRIATPAQRRALAARDRGCVMPGCAVPAERCQIHHLRPWTEGGSTDLGNLVSLCTAHHREVDLGRWDLHADGPGATAPDDAHHARAHRDPAHVPGGTPASRGAPFRVTTRRRTQWGAGP